MLTDNAHDALASYLSQSQLLSAKEIYQFMQYWKEVRFRRKQPITREGQVEHYLYFVVEGVQRTYHIKGNKEHTISFSYPPSFSGIFESFISQLPSRYTLDTLSDSHLLRLPKARLEELCDQSHGIERFVRRAEEKALVGLAQRLLEQMSFSAEEKFLALLNRSPHLLHLIPHKYLATYLGIDPTNFSKFLGRIKV